MRAAAAPALLAALGLLACGLPSPAAAQGPTAPLDRAVVALPPVYPAPPPGFLRLPETRLVRRGGPAAPETPGARPTWQPARLEATVGVDARGRLTSVLEYTPGRFER